MEFDADADCLPTIDEGVSFSFRVLCCRVRFGDSVLPRNDLEAAEGLRRGLIEGVSDSGLGVFEGMEGGLAGGAEVACPSAREEGKEGAKVAAGGALVSGGEGGVQIGEGYPIC